MFTTSQINEMSYFHSLKTKMMNKQHFNLIKGFADNGGLLSLTKDTYVFKHRMNIDKFYLILRGKCICLVPKSVETINKEQNELHSKYPGITALPQNFYWNWEKQKIQLVYKGTEQYPRDHLQVLSYQINQLQIPSYVMPNLLPHLFDAHIVRFKEIIILKEQQPLIEQITKKAPVSIYTLEECDFLTLDLPLYEDLVDASQKKQKEFIENLLFKAFEDSIKIGPDLKRILQEVQLNSQVLKLMNHTTVYSSAQLSTYVYLIIKGEFQISYQNTNMETVPEKDNLSQYQKFKKFIRMERDPITQTRTPIYLTEEINHLKKQHQPIQKEYQLLKLGPGQLMGDEEFTFDCFNQLYHSFKSKCVTTNAKVLAIKKVDLYKICVIHDWFSKIFHKRCEFKRNWFTSRFQFQYLQDLRNLNINISPRINNQVGEEIQFLKLIDGETIKQKCTRVSGSTSPQRTMTTRSTQRKLQLKKIILDNKQTNPNNIGMIEYLIKLDRHKQMLLQHQIRKALEPGQQTLVTEQEQHNSPSPIRKSQSYRIHRSSSMKPI